MVYNGSKTREWTAKEYSASPTASAKSIMLLMVINTTEGRDVMMADLPNAFIQVDLPEGEERVMMKNYRSAG